MIQIDNVSLSKRLANIKIAAQSGEFVHVLGANGAGKSSLLSVLAGLIPADSGQILYQLNGMQHEIQQLTLPQLSLFRCFQEQQQQTPFDLTVQESLQFFANFQQLPIQLESGLEIGPFLSRQIKSLSGGESRRVHIARVLLQIWPKLMAGEGLILMDEPIQGLDFRHQHLLFKLLKSLSSLGNTIIASHHDLNLCFAYSDQVWLMKQGEIFQSGTNRAVMTDKLLSEAFACNICQYSHLNEVIFQTYLD